MASDGRRAASERSDKPPRSAIERRQGMDARFDESPEQPAIGLCRQSPYRDKPCAAGGRLLQD